MELSKLKIKNTRYCECGHTFTMDARISEIVKNTNYHFYGGRAEYFANVKCPECSREYIAMIERTNNGYRIFDIAETEATNAEKEKEVIEEFVCEKCKRTFKSKSGLALHRRNCL